MQTRQRNRFGVLFPPLPRPKPSCPQGLGIESSKPVQDGMKLGMQAHGEFFFGLSRTISKLSQ